MTAGSPGVLVLVAGEREEIAARGEGFGGLGEGLSGNVPGGGALVAGRSEAVIISRSRSGEIRGRRL